MISDFERIARFGMGHLLNEITACPFAIVSAHEANGDSVSEMADPKRGGNELKHRLWELGFGFIGMSGAWIDQTIRWASEGSLLVPAISVEKAIGLAREFDQEAVLLGKNGRLCVVFTDGTTANLELGEVDGFIDLGTAGRIVAAPKATHPPYSDSEEFFYCYSGRPPTGVAKYGFIPRSESPIPLAHLSTLIEV